MSAPDSELIVESIPTLGDAPREQPWIEWIGGDCPVAAGTPVSVRLRGGGAAIRILFPEALVWWHIAESHDIVAYRVEA
jgi:hypothetical protein